ncbi:MAG: hypothetical protein JXQ69_05290 [Paludibacteraceae bacterium]|nr:hypothetical protein [Paludibacteraceae bacterium]
MKRISNMKKSFLFIVFIGFSLVSFSQSKLQKINLMADVYIEANWTDSVKVATYYDFQLLGNKGKINNMKVKLKMGALEQLKDNKYRVMLSATDKALELTITKFDPMSKEDKLLKEIKVPVKK